MTSPRDRKEEGKGLLVRGTPCPWPTQHLRLAGCTYFENETTKESRRKQGKRTTQLRDSVFGIERASTFARALERLSSRGQKHSFPGYLIRRGDSLYNSQE